MEEELIRRAEDLARRCSRSAVVTNTGFLTPAEVYALSHWQPQGADCTVLFHGGFPGAERQAAFFLPDWMEAAYFEADAYLSALELTVRFGNPGHRDVLGAVMGLGIGREWVGDILIDGERVWLVCLPSVKQHLLNLEKIGRWGAKVREIPLSELPEAQKKYRETVFSVKSLRLDAACAGIFGLSRTAASAAIGQGLVSLNYTVCLKPDAPIRDGDILSLRGKGKAVVLDAGSRSSQKGRLFLKAGVYQ